MYDKRRPLSMLSSFLPKKVHKYFFCILPACASGASSLSSLMLSLLPALEIFAEGGESTPLTFDATEKRTQADLYRNKIKELFKKHLSVIFY